MSLLLNSVSPVHSPCTLHDPFGQHWGSRALVKTITFEFLQKVVFLFCLFNQPIWCQGKLVSSRVRRSEALAKMIVALGMR